MKSTGSQVKTECAIAPVSSVAATVDGLAIDMKGFRSCVFTGISGLETGTPTAYQIIWKVQESTDGSTFSDITGKSVTETGDISAAYGDEEIDIELELDLTSYSYRYLRLAAVITFTGGTTPAITVAGTVTKGEAVNSE